MNPVFGLVAPVAGQVRYLNVRAADQHADPPDPGRQRLGDGKSHHVEVPAGPSSPAAWSTTGPP